MRYLKSFIMLESIDPDDIRICFDGLLDIGFSYDITDMPRKRHDTQYIMVEIIKINGNSRDFTRSDDVEIPFYWDNPIRDEIKSAVGKADEMGYMVNATEAVSVSGKGRTIDIVDIEPGCKLTRIEMFFKEK